MKTRENVCTSVDKAYVMIAKCWNEKWHQAKWKVRSETKLPIKIEAAISYERKQTIVNSLGKCVLLLFLLQRSKKYHQILWRWWCKDALLNASEDKKNY